MESQLISLSNIVASVVAGLITQFAVAYWNDRRITRQSNRSAANFIADKRQKWIDDLRNDMAIHLASSQEYIWKFDAIRQECKELEKKLSEEPGKIKKRNDIECSEQKKMVEEIYAKNSDLSEKLLKEFSIANGQRDREHHERHFRIKLRLNPIEQEGNEAKLRIKLDKIRETMSDMQNAEKNEENKKVIENMKELILECSRLTEQILKTEWERIKSDVKDEQYK